MQVCTRFRLSIILTPCTSTQRKLVNEQRKSYRILISSCRTTDIRLLDFYRKRGLGPDQCHYNQSRLCSRLQTTLAQITRNRPQVKIHYIEDFFTVHDFWATFVCPEKTELPWNVSLYWIYFLHSGFLTTCACPENRVSPGNFHCIVYIFCHSGFLSNFALALKIRVAKKFFTVLKYFLHSGVLSNLRLSWKNRVALNIFTVLNMYFLLFRIFEQLVLALKNRVALEFFTVLGM